MPETPAPRIQAKWERVLRELAETGFINQLSKELYEITDEGYQAAENCGIIPP